MGTESKSALTGWVLAILRAMRAEGIDADSAMLQLGMDPAQLRGGYSRYSQEKVSGLWTYAMQHTGDAAFGLKVAAEVRPATFHVVGHAMSCSCNLLRALQRFAFYCRLISDSAAAALTESGERVSLEFHFDTGGAPPIYQTVDTVLAAVLAYLRWIAHEQLVPIEVRLRHERPADDAAFAEFFGSPIRYGQDKDGIVFRKHDLEQPILASDEELATLLDGAADRYLERRMAGRFAVRVRDSLIAQLPHGAPSKGATAAKLHMTERTLLRRLKDEGTTFAEVLDRLREELAFQYLQRKDLKLSGIADQLGFSDNSTFSRAFKRWTGRRPSAVLRTEPAAQV